MTAQPVEPGSMPTFSEPEPHSLLTASPAERRTASDTRLYVISAFHSVQTGPLYNISVVDPASGHVLHEIPVTGGAPGLAVSPDGKRLYVVDGEADGRLRVIDTATWQVIHQEPIADRALFRIGFPLSLSSDGRWLLVDHYSHTREIGWISVFDTWTLKFQFNAGDRRTCPACSC